MKRLMLAATLVAMLMALTPLMAGATGSGGGHPECANRQEIQVNAQTFTVPGGGPFEVWSKAGNNDHVNHGVLAAGTVITSGEFNDKGKEKDISHVDLCPVDVDYICVDGVVSEVPDGEGQFETREEADEECVVDDTTPTIPEDTTTTTSTTTTTVVTTIPVVTFCVDPNTATISQLEQVPGIDFQTALAIVNTTSFDSQFESVAEVQATFGLGDEVLTGTEENPGFFDDSCLTFVSSEEPTTTTTAAPTTTGSNPTTTDPTLLPFTGPEEDQRMFALSASGLILLGVALVASARRSRSE